MTKSAYHYPPDEFDVAVPGGAPVGVHRAPRSGWSSVWPFLLVAAICSLVAWGGFTLLADGGASPAGGTGAASPDPSAAASPPSSATPSPPPSALPEKSYPGDPELANLTDTVIGIYNDGAGAGMAGVAATNLVAAGFTGPIHPLDAGVDPTAPQPGTYSVNTVLYGGERADTATAIAQALGVSAENVEQSQQVSNHETEGVWVVLTTPPSS